MLRQIIACVRMSLKKEPHLPMLSLLCIFPLWSATKPDPLPLKSPHHLTSKFPSRNGYGTFKCSAMETSSSRGAFARSAISSSCTKTTSTRWESPWSHIKKLSSNTFAQNRKSQRDNNSKSLPGNRLATPPHENQIRKSMYACMYVFVDAVCISFHTYRTRTWFLRFLLAIGMPCICWVQFFTTGV